MTDKKKIVVSDAAPLIQLALAHWLDILPRLYNVVIPKEVFEETQHYRELPDSIEIAKATGKWLVVMSVRDRKQVSRFLDQKWGKGEAGTVVLCEEIDADSLLTSDMYAASRATKLGLKTITIGDVVKEAHALKAMTPVEAVNLLKMLIDQNILNTRYLRQLLEEAKTWS